MVKPVAMFILLNLALGAFLLGGGAIAVLEELSERAENLPKAE